jgi:hypothetical protein
MGHVPIHARSALFWSGSQSKQVTQVGGLGFNCGSADEPCMLSSLPRIDNTQRVSASTLQVLVRMVKGPVIT